MVQYRIIVVVFCNRFWHWYSMTWGPRNLDMHNRMSAPSSFGGMWVLFYFVFSCCLLIWMWFFGRLLVTGCLVFWLGFRRWLWWWVPLEVVCCSCSISSLCTSHSMCLELFGLRRFWRVTKVLNYYYLTQDLMIWGFEDGHNGVRIQKAGYVISLMGLTDKEKEIKMKCQWNKCNKNG